MVWDKYGLDSVWNQTEIHPVRPGPLTFDPIAGIYSMGKTIFRTPWK
jgi:hypothetical protein